MHAYDTMLSFYGRDIFTQIQQINVNLEYVRTWLITNKLSLYVNKIEFIVIDTMQRFNLINDIDVDFDISVFH